MRGSNCHDVFDVDHETDTNRAAECSNFVVMSGNDVDGPRVAPDRPAGSGDKAPRIAIALSLTVLVTIALIASTVAILWLL